jgi:DeoR/GlpR family transcriptional regulator of sugar metabolism
MLGPERHRQILRLLAERGRLTSAEVRSRLGVSAATARRDFASIAGAGHATRAHGALLPHDFSLVEPPYPRKSERAVNAKARLGRAAAALVPEVGAVFVDAGTTCLEVGRALLERAGLRIFTNSVPLLALAGESRASLSSIGGEARPVSLALTGALSQSWLENLRFDAVVVGASGLDAGAGASTTEVAEAAVKAEALRRARRRILVAHAEKWGRPSSLRFAPWGAFTDFVTDRILSREERSVLAAARVRLHTVSPR